MHDAPACWGRHETNEATCISCLYAQACRLYTETEPAMTRPFGGQDFDHVAEWAPDLADYSAIPGEEPIDEEDRRESLNLAGFLRFLLHLDGYTLGILAEIIAPSHTPGKRHTVADLARIHGISRQGMHRKVLDVARKSPELASLLSMTVKKIQKARHEFTTPRCRAIPTGQQEFHF